MNKLWLNLHLFFQGAVLSYIALFRWLNLRSYLASKVFMPLTLMLFFVLLGTYATGQNNVAFYLIGNAVQTAAVSGIFGVTMSIGGDRWDGMLPYLFGTSANRLVMLIGRSFIHVIDGTLGVVFALFWGVVLLGLDLSRADPLALSLTILITTFSTSGLGLLLGCLSLITRNVMFVNNTVFFLLLIFSGANVKIDSLPTWMQAVSQVIPLTRGIISARQIVAGKDLKEVIPLLNGEILIGLGYIFLGYVMFRRLEFQAKQRGTLEIL